MAKKSFNRSIASIKPISNSNSSNSSLIPTKKKKQNKKKSNHSNVIDSNDLNPSSSISPSANSIHQSLKNKSIDSNFRTDMIGSYPIDHSISNNSLSNNSKIKSSSKSNQNAQIDHEILDDELDHQLALDQNINQDDEDQDHDQDQDDDDDEQNIQNHHSNNNNNNNNNFNHNHLNHQLDHHHQHHHHHHNHHNHLNHHLNHHQNLHHHDLIDQTDDRLTSHSMHPSLAAATRQTQEDLLATANDLYRQIETAAAAALASHLSPQSLANITNNNGNNNNTNNSTLPSSNNLISGTSSHSSNQHSNHPDDDTYWTSLPAHLRSFIRSALPLAAGHSSSNNNTNSNNTNNTNNNNNNNQTQSSIQNHTAILPNLSSFAHATGMITSTNSSNSQQNLPQLSSEQMAAAAEQLARVVQTHDWGRAVSTAAQQAGLTHNNHLLNGSNRSSHNFNRDSNNTSATVSVTGGTVTGTIPLGSFTLPLPLHSHPDQHHHHQQHHPHHQSHHQNPINVNEPVYYTGETTIVTSRLSDKHNGDKNILNDDYYADEVRGIRTENQLNNGLIDNPLNHSNQNQATNNSSPATTTTNSKKKKKNKKKNKSTNPSTNNPSNPPIPNINFQTSSPGLPSLPLPPTSKSTSQLQPTSKKSGTDLISTNQSNLNVPTNRLHQIPSNTTQSKKKPSGLNPLTNKLRQTNNSTSSSTITNTTSNNPNQPPTERERIRDFWLTLNQEERANLVKIEKDAVLKKMKEQQRHSCSCAVCGRKRLAIEQELEVLYDAYYDELENYAEASKKYYSSESKAKIGKGLPGPYPKPPGPGPFPGSVDIITTSTQTQTQTQLPSKKTVPKPTRDHKNVRPRPQHTIPQQVNPPIQQSNNLNNPHYQQPQPNPKRNVPPPNQLKKHNNHNDHDHTHSPSCPHHPHHHGPNHYHHPTNPNNRGKGVATNLIAPQIGHPRINHQQRPPNEIFPDEDGDEDDDEDDEDEEEYDEDEEEEYDEDEEEEGEFEDDDEIPALEEVPSETPEQNNNPNKKPNLNGTNTSNNKVTNGTEKSNGPNPNNGDLFGFGNSLTVKGGILTVADDLLRNDGQKFLEMMESLADKRIQRERDAAENLLAGLEDDENDGDEYDDEEDEDDELEDDDGFDDEIITEEYRMKEGRRMFQIFAARMFEQRVLTAYREKVAQEKQAQLLRELEDEDRLAQERELKKVKDAQKKKEKKKAQKQQKDQDLAKKLKDKEAEEKAAKAAEEAKLEAEKRRQEEQRIKREAQRKQQEAERAKKEEERRKRIEEEARKRKEKEEKARLEKEAKAAREREERERKAKEEAERKLKAEAEKKEREAREAKVRAEAERKRQAEADKLEVEEAAKREAAKVAAAKLTAQNKNSNALSAQKPTQRSPVSIRSQTVPKAINTSSKIATNVTNPTPVPMPLGTYPPPHTPNRQVPPPAMLPRQMSIGIGLGRPSSAAAAPPFSAAIPPMSAGPSSYSNISPRPPSAQYGSSFPISNSAYPPPPGALPPDMRMPLNGIQTPLVTGGPFIAMNNFQPPMGPMIQPINHNNHNNNNNRVFSSSTLPLIPQHHHYVNQPPHQAPTHRASLASSAMPLANSINPTGIISPTLSSGTSPLSALHLGSEPVRKASVSAVGPIGPSSSSHIRRSSGIDDTITQSGICSNSIEPIGRPKVNGTVSTLVEPLSNNSDRDSNNLTFEDTLPNQKAQNVLGSSALLEDDETTVNFPRRHTMPTNVPPSSNSTTTSSFVPAAAFEAGLGVTNSIWGTTTNKLDGSGWGSSTLSTPPHLPASQPVGPTLARTPLQSNFPVIGGVTSNNMGNARESTTDWLRRRAISAYCNMRLDEKWIPVGDVSIEMQRIHPDTISVGLKDMVDACLIKRNLNNGGGDWQFNQLGNVLFTRWLPISSQQETPL
ncbi:hypothetical protein O181_045355 [Austropuccinia psidii MF-1]|uniref:Stress response protein NST1 n=1 Tax=Austropuccinia psidii MF-1 TaxID=1389203 RepID=A0A9Q3DR99_9BASI|nr:hypothetical protein [Austropuccinia psidii MF-1]